MLDMFFKLLWKKQKVEKEENKNENNSKDDMNDCGSYDSNEHDTDFTVSSSDNESGPNNDLK